MVTPEELNTIGERLNNKDNSLAERFRALFTLRNLGGKQAVDLIAQSFDDSSALLKHELAYCLGQMQNECANPILISVLKDVKQEPMVRHEAAEALGAIGSQNVIEILQKFAKDAVIEVAETCELALERIRWLQNQENNTEKEESPYSSVDPAPPSVERNVNKLRQALLDESKPLFDRYRAMFSLRNIQTKESVLALADGLNCASALFRHEIAYVLGQIQHEAAIEALSKSLKDATENPMVRHECAEALGSIAKEDCLATLTEYVKDKERVVNESCEVALDMYEYETSNQFQYADGLQK
eukprot:Seg6889.1 transcript_id=Seg6889.1/GoldUCD/mRNA.D3Y31 product="Deoxyhypusine hydroxylase" protein_id=Seg6889.1/GoldUCD/D3Y31